MKHHEFSPSSLEQYRLCPGSYQMQQGIPEQPSDAAAEGTLLHNAVATGNFDGLTSDQIELVTKCIEFRNSFAEPDTLILNEEFVSVHDENGDEITTGTADCIILPRKPVPIVIDWKFGYTPVNDVNKNIQLATYALGVMQEYKVDSVDAWVFQPRLHKKTHHIFTNATAILSNIKNIINAAASENIYLKPSEAACRYCKARLSCPAFRVKFQKLMASRNDYDMNHIPTLEKLFDASKSIKTFLNEIENAVKSVIEEKGACGKYVFQTTEGAREIKDLNALYSVVKNYLTTAEFNNVCKVSVSKLESAVADRMIAGVKANGGKLSKAEAKSTVSKMISELVTRGNPKKTIVEVA